MLNSKKYVLSISVSIILSSYLHGLTACSTNDDGDYVVTNNSTGGIDSLPLCVSEANNDGVDSKIIFDGDYTISLTDEISITTDGAITIDGGTNNIVINGDSDSRIFNISNTAKTTLQNLTLQNGTVPESDDQEGETFSGGAIFANNADFDIKSCTLSGNLAPQGGAIYSSYSDVMIIDSTIISNTGSYTAGAIDTFYGSLTIENTTISSNISSQGAGGLESYYADVSIKNSTISNNSARFAGGAFFIYGTLLLENTTISNNSANHTGGVGIHRTETLITNSKIINNSATEVVGGLSFDSMSASVVIDSSTISGNTAGATSGGIYIRYNEGFSIKNSTISGNSASTKGGGIYMSNCHASVNIINTTITNNTADQGGGVWVYDADLNISNSILSGNSATTQIDANTIGSSGHNILGDIDTVTPLDTDIQTTDPKLDPLADNGGVTKTHALQKDSPAVDAGYSTIPLDQRGEARDSSPDIGSYEYQGSSNIVPIINYLLF